MSYGARKLVTEVGGLVVALVLGAVTLTHRTEVEDLLASSLNIHLRAPAVAETRAANADDGIERSTRKGGVELTAGNYGHFFADADINGRSVSVIVDTGASMVALTYDDARNAGFSLRDSDFTGRTRTANGVSKVAPVMIDRIMIGDLEVRNVQGVVAEEGALSMTLLGMTFLGRLGSVSMKSGRLVLEE